MKIFNRTTWFRLGLVSGVLAVTSGGYALARYQLWPAYRAWSISRTNELARDFLAADDPRNALLAVRKVLSTRPNNIEALRLGVKAADRRSSVEAVLFQRNLCRVEKSSADYLELIRLALKYEISSIALESIQAMAEEASNLPEYHRLAAETYRKIHRDAETKQHLVRLLGLRPNDRAASLALAETEFAMDPKRLPADWAPRVAALTREPDWALPATLLQLRAAIARRASSDAAELSVQVLSRSDLDLAARLYVVEAAFLYDPPAAARMLTSLQYQVSARADEVVRTMDFMLGQSQFAAVKSWYSTLDDPVKQNERVKFSAAQACRALRDWAGMEKLLRGARWKEEEPLRLGLLAYAFRMAGRAGDFAETWKLAVNATGQDARQVMILLRNVEQWHWVEERYDLLWKLFNLMPAAPNVQELLIAREYRKGDTVNLNKIYARALEVRPEDENLQNNFAYTSLLLGTNENRARQIARELNRKHPEDALYLTTYTLALHQQGLSREALDLVEKASRAEPAASTTQLHEAVYAAAVGELDRAGRILKDLALGGLLPEEQHLADEARMAIVRAEQKRERESTIAALGPATATGSGWLAVLPVRTAAVSDDLKLAEVYFRKNDFPALRDLLQSTRWGRDEHLRCALFAFVERRQSRAGAAEGFWRQAFSSAERDLSRLRDLQALATRWNWPAERMAVIDRLFEIEDSASSLPEELLDYYRQQSRTPDLARLYSRYVERTNTKGPEAAWCVYYSLLCGMNVTFAQTLAERIHREAPQDPLGKIVYAYSLWRQQRAGEAWPFLQDRDKQELAGMQVELLAAGVLMDLGRIDDARSELVKFNRMNALPEEIKLAETLSRRLGLVSASLAASTK